MDLRQAQLEVFQDLLRLEQHVLCQFLPKKYNQIDYHTATVNLSTARVTGATSVSLTNDAKKMAKKEIRTMLQDEIKRYETRIQEYENQCQQGLRELEQYYLHQTRNGIPLIDIIRNYFNCRQEKTVQNFINTLTAYRMKLLRRRRRYMAKRQRITPSPEILIDAPGVSFKSDQITYLSRGKSSFNDSSWAFRFSFLLLGPKYIRPNQSWLLTQTKQNKWLDKEFQTIMNKIVPYLLRKYNIKSEYQVMKDLSVQLKTQIHGQYAASLSSRDVLRAREDLRIMKSIRRKLRKRKLILRITDKSNIFYIGRAIDFEKKVQAYREKTNAYQELTSNPLEAILLKVTRLLNDLRAKNCIQANQYDDMMPKRAKVRLGYMYFNPKVHKV